MFNKLRNSINSFNKTTNNVKRKQSRVPPNNKIRQIISDINEDKVHFENYSFLILLSDQYFKKKYFFLPSKNYYIKKNRFPGKLIIEKYSDLTFNNNYKFESNPIPNKIYIKLQKEGIFVLYHEYEKKILESKFNEFFDILTTIGAKYIKIAKKINNIQESEIGIGLTYRDTIISNNIVVKEENETSLQVTKEMIFNNDKDPILSSIYDNNYFYLPNQPDLQHLIIRRIEKNLISDRYIYDHSHHNVLNHDVITRLNKLNIGLNYDFKQISNFHIEYEIIFNSIKDLNINLYYNEDETDWLYRTVSRFINIFY